MNWPNHRGTATAFPLSAFGLGAFFFTTISIVAFPDNTSDLLILISAGTFGLCMASLYFIRLLPHPVEYSAIPTDDRRESNPLKRSKSRERPYHNGHRSEDSGTLPDSSQDSTELEDPEETSSLISKDSVPGDILVQEDNGENKTDTHSRFPDVRGLTLLRKVEFYQLWFMLGVFTGFGLMTIK